MVTARTPAPRKEQRPTILRVGARVGRTCWQWVRAHVPNLLALAPSWRVAVGGGLLMAALGASAMLVAVLAGRGEGLVGKAGLYSPLVCVAFATTAYGFAILGAGICERQSSRRSWQYPALAATGLFVVLTALVTVPARIPDFTDGAVQYLLLTGPLWAGATAVIGVLAVTRSGGPGTLRGMVVALLLPFASVLMSAAVSLILFHDIHRGVQVLFSGLLILAFPAVVIPPALLIWLAVEGLRGSRDFGLWLVDRGPPMRVMASALAAKIVLLATALTLSALGPASKVVPTAPEPGAYLIALPLVLISVWLLTRETRVGGAARHLSLAAAGTALLLAGVLVPVGLFGPTLIVMTVASHWPLAGGAFALATYAGSVTVWGRSWSTRRHVLVGIPVACLASLIGFLGALRRVRIDVSVGALPVPTAPQLGAVLGVSLLFTLAILAGTQRGRLRAVLGYAVALASWIVATTVLPPLGGVAGATPIAFDVLLTVAIATAALAWRRGLQRSVSPEELLLLLVVMTAVVEAPVIADFAPERWGRWLLPLALITPAIMQVTSDVKFFNTPGPGHLTRVLMLTGALCICYGLLSTLAIAVGNSIAVVPTVVDFVNGLIAVPFAVLLVVATSASKWGMEERQGTRQFTESAEPAESAEPRPTDRSAGC